jgi:hypothetical protein
MELKMREALGSRAMWKLKVKSEEATRLLC